VWCYDDPVMEPEPDEPEQASEEVVPEPVVYSVWDDLKPPERGVEDMEK
jgi:hypothetical protein